MTNIQKTLASVAAAALLGTGGITIYLNGSENTADTGSVMSDLQSTAGNAVDDINQAVSEGVGKIESATSEGVAAIKGGTSQVITASDMPEPKIVKINIETKPNFGELTFTSAEINYEYKSIIFTYEIKSMSIMSHPVPNSTLTNCVDKIGNTVVTGSFGGGGNRDDNNFSGYGSLEFYGFQNIEDASTVTVTYAFEGFDSVTVTFDIPGI